MPFHRLLGVAIPLAIGCSSGTGGGERKLAYHDLRSDGQTIAHDVDRVERVAQLPSGHLAFVEPFRRRVVFLDLARGVQTTFGRDGRGPGEFSNVPQAVLALGGDSVGVLNQTGTRLLVFTPRGYAFSSETPIRTMPNEFDCHTDAAAVIYCRVEGTIGGREFLPPGAPRPASVPIIRFRVGETAFDSIWTIAARGYRTYESRDGSVLVRAEPLHPVSGFGASADGSLWRILGKELRADVRRPDGTGVSGPAWELEPRPVSAQERDSVLAVARAGRFGQFELTVHPTRPVFREVKIAPWGVAWVRLSTWLAENRYRLFDAAGHAFAEVDLNPDDRVVGFSTTQALVLREAASGEYSLVGLTLSNSLRAVSGR